MKRYLAFAVALFMLLALMSCGGGTDETVSREPTPDYFADYDPNTPPAQPGDVTLPLVSEPKSFEYWLPSWAPFGVQPYDTDYMAWLEAETGVHIEFLIPPVGTEGENFMGIVLSGEYPDLFGAIDNYYQGGADKALNDELIVRLNGAVDRWLPHYRVVAERDAETYIQCVNDSGDIWGLHTIYDGSRGASVGLGVRADWLDRLGMTVGDLETVDGLDRALEGFTQFTADGAGPLWLGPGSIGNQYALNGSYGYAGVEYSAFINRDGRAVYAAYEGLKDYAAQMADWYARGLINKSYIVRSSLSVPQYMWTGGEIGVGDVAADDIAYFESASSDPDCRISALTTPKLRASDSWSDIHLRQFVPSVDTRASVSVSVTCSDLMVVCQYLDFALKSSWDRSASVPADVMLTDADSACSAWDLVDCDWVWPAGATLTREESVAVSSAIANCNMAVTDWITQVILGNKSADTYDDLIAEIESMEIGRVTDTYQAALDRYYARASYLRA